MTDTTITAAGGLSARRAILLLIFGALMIGFAPIAVRVSEVGPQATAFWRFAFALPFITLLALRFDGGVAAPAPARGFLIAAGLCFGIDIALWHGAITLTTVANATLLSNLTPIVVGVIGLVFFREKISRNVVLGGALGVIGAACLAGASLASTPGRLPGDALALFTAFWYGLYFVFIRQGRRAAGPFVASLWASFCALGVCLITTLWLEDRFFPATLQGWAVLVGLGALVHALGQGAIVFALGRAPAALAAVVVLVQPVMASLLGFVLFGEAFGPLDFLGAGLVLFGVWMAQRPAGKIADETPAEP